MSHDTGQWIVIILLAAVVGITQATTLYLASARHARERSKPSLRWCRNCGGTVLSSHRCEP